MTPTQLRARLGRIPAIYVATRRELAREYSRRCPRAPLAWAFLASSLTDLCLYDQARVALRRLETLAADDPYVVGSHWGHYYRAMGDLKRAEHWYRKAADAAPAALVFLGALLAIQGRFAEAKRCHRKAVHARASVHGSSERRSLFERGHSTQG